MFGERIGDVKVSDYFEIDFLKINAKRSGDAIAARLLAPVLYGPRITSKELDEFIILLTDTLREQSDDQKLNIDRQREIVSAQDELIQDVRRVLERILFLS